MTATYRSPRAYLVYATAPAGSTLKEANAAFNAYCAAPGRGVPLYHDHVRELPGGGVALFYLDGPEQLEGLRRCPELPGWELAVHALIHSEGREGFARQVAFTARHYARETA